MEPIVSPWFIYLLNFVENLGVAFMIIAIFTGLGLFGMGIWWLTDIEDYDEDDEKYIK